MFTKLVLQMKMAPLIALVLTKRRHFHYFFSGEKNKKINVIKTLPKDLWLLLLNILRVQEEKLSLQQAYGHEGIPGL